MSGKILWSDRKRTIFGLPWSFTKYKCTAEKFTIETGILSKKEEEIRLYRILDITLLRPLSQRIFGLGTIHCCSADKTSGDFDIKRIKHPVEVKDALSDLIEEQRMKKRVYSRESMHESHDDDIDDNDDNGDDDDDDEYGAHDDDY